MISALYFNGFWSKPFAENQTMTQNFSVKSETTVPAKFMSKTGHFHYAESIELNAKILRLPYKVNMTISLSS